METLIHPRKCNPVRYFFKISACLPFTRKILQTKRRPITMDWFLLGYFLRAFYNVQTAECDRANDILQSVHPSQIEDNCYYCVLCFPTFSLCDVQTCATMQRTMSPKPRNSTAFESTASLLSASSFSLGRFTYPQNESRRGSAQRQPARRSA